MGFKENLIKYRKKQGLSQEDLGNEIGVTRQTISKWELGETKPDVDKILQLSKVFNVSSDLLIDNSSTNILGRRTCKYEYVSKRKLFGLPLIHINIGSMRTKAKGIIAIGNMAFGLIAIGFLSLGIISIGIISIALLALGVIGIGFLSIASLAIGVFAVGAISIGYISIGGVSIGIYSIGGLSVANKVAYGSNSIAPVSFSTNNNTISFTKNEISNAILDVYPNIPKYILKIFKYLGSSK